MGRKYNPDRFNKVDNTYYFPKGSILQFVPADEELRFLAMRHDLVLIDEAYVVKKGIFDQVEIRTRLQILLTWNPVAPFWATKLQDQRDDVAVIHATYHDNPHVEESIIKALETRANTDPNFYRVYVLGKYGSLEGLIFDEGKNWRKCEALPEDHQRRIFVVDYGFSQDPTAINELLFSDGQFWTREIEYKTGMFNKEIHDCLKREIFKETDEIEEMTHEQLLNLKTQIEIVADSAEPKSNAELTGMGLNVIASVKGPDSVRHGIRTMKGFVTNVTKDSTNTIKELRRYSYKKDRDGEFTGEPIKGWDHCIDGLRYGETHIRRNPNYGSYSVS